MKRGVALLLVTLVFLSGVVVGVLATRIRDSRHPMGPRGERRAGFSERLRDELSLTPEQSERIVQIIRDGHVESRALRESLRPRVHAITEKNARRIDEVLTPEQREKFKVLRRENGRRADVFLLGRGESLRRDRHDHRRPPPMDESAAGDEEDHPSPLALPSP